MICTFFGHGDTPDSVEPLLRKLLQECIQTGQADTFYVGNQGRFDALVLKVLREFKQQYPSLRYDVVLAYMPGKAGNDHSLAPAETVFPEDMENVPPRYAICQRNRWMVKQADLVITYVCHPFGGAARFAQMAEAHGKTVINLAKPG